jgi:shikimate 5-dehydrogenase
MPHKVTTMGLVDEISPTAQVAGAINAVLLREDGSLLADQFDGSGVLMLVQPGPQVLGVVTGVCPSAPARAG